MNQKKTEILNFQIIDDNLNFIEKNIGTEEDIQKVYLERTTNLLEQDYRDLKKHEQISAQRMLPLLEQLMNSEEEKLTLGMLLHKFYWSKFIKQ